MASESTAAVINNEVFIRTQLGAQEVANVTGSVLPREARTLLILIDGRKSYAQVTRLLENRKMFRTAGGLKRHLQMLIDLDYIKFTNPDLFASNDSSLERESEHCEITLFTKTYDQEDSLIGNEASQSNSDLNAVTNTRAITEPTSNSAQSIDQLRSIMLTLIAKHDDQATVETYSIALNQCQSMHCVFDLIQKLKSQSSGQFEVALTMAARAFKNSKVH